MKKIATLFPLLLLLIVFSLLTTCYFILWRIPKEDEIYASSLRGVVELRGSIEDNESFGSAVFIDSDGTLVTNFHMTSYKKGGVYYPFTSLSIRLANETNYHEVSLISKDETLDIALLKLENPSEMNFKPIKILESPLKGGETVYAVGNGMNHGIGISKGIVSLPLVEIEVDEKVKRVIQADLTINEGNSGGALLDSKGRLRGITTFRIKDSLSNIIYGMAYSIPIENVLEFKEK